MEDRSIWRDCSWSLLLGHRYGILRRGPLILERFGNGNSEYAVLPEHVLGMRIRP